MTAFSHLTIQAPARSVHKEEGSKFLGFGYPVASEEEVKNQLQNSQKR